MTVRMRTLLTPVLAVAGLVGAAGPADAAWNNVFQVCCHDRPRASFYAPPAPCPEKRVEYVQRSYYQPVTEMHQERYKVPVQQRVRSYYYEPVTSYRRSCYYDPCTGCPQEITEPVTSYRVRERCETVTKWIERCRMVPVTSYRQVTMYQPVVSYYYPPNPCPPDPCPPGGSAAYPPARPPSVDEFRSNPPRVADPERGTELIPPPGVPTDPMKSVPRAMPPKPSTSARVMTASRSGTPTVRGEVVRNDKVTPRPGAKLVFVNATDPDKRQFARANEFGEFDVRLAPGSWYLYLDNGAGKGVYHKKIAVEEYGNPAYTVVSR